MPMLNLKDFFNVHSSQDQASFTLSSYAVCDKQYPNGERTPLNIGYV